MRGLLIHFAVRWLASSLGLFVAAGLLGSTRLSVGGNLTTVAAAGFFLALVNMAIKPVLVLLSFPVILMSIGIFMLVINGFMILLVSYLYSPLFVKNLGVAIIAGLIVGFVNFLVSKVLEDLV
ncbi:phage holin family protein [Candidatus Saccharibacteria bacterium]|nr:phage holin family protein [Candidatus Saccharibacteria bacterium]